MSRVKHGPMYRLDLYPKGSGGGNSNEQAVPVRTILSPDKDKLKSKRRKYEDQYDVWGPFQVDRRSGGMIPRVNVMKTLYQERRAEAEAREEKKKQLDAIQNPSLAEQSKVAAAN